VTETESYFPAFISHIYKQTPRSSTRRLSLSSSMIVVYFLPQKFQTNNRSENEMLIHFYKLFG